jgi:aminomethyltransferase
MSNLSSVFHLALREWHAAAGATFDVRTGWTLPMRYGDPSLEYAALRESTVVFDRSHRSRILVAGTDALDVLKSTFAGHLEELHEGRAMRTVALDADGNIRDLVLIARTGGIAYLVSGEAGQRFETFQRLNSAVSPDFDVRVDDRTETTCLLGIAGSAAGQVAIDHLSESLPARLKPMQCFTFEFHGFRALGIRTSDTSEDGFELMLAPAVAQHVLETLRAAGVQPAGHEALDAARIEACLPAFSPDLEPGLSAAEADLDALLEIDGGREGRILSALLVDSDAALMPGTSLAVNGERIGEIRSCVRSPGLNATIALGIIDVRHAFPGRQLDADGVRVTVVAKPFYRKRG